MTAAGITTLNCTRCGAGLSVHGGGRVVTHVCEHCGAVLDAQDDYRVLKQFKDRPRPETPFRIGRWARIDDVKFTVIGTIAWRETFQGKSWQWVDHQLYSPTHGYAWLTWEDGHVVFSRKVRGAAKPHWIKPSEIAIAAHRPSVTLNGEVYSYYGSGVQKPTFIEGEFNYSPELNTRVNYVSFLGDRDMFVMQREGDEIEYELARWLPRDETLRAFGTTATGRQKPKGVHPARGFERGPRAAFARNALLGGGAAGLALALAFAAFGGTVERAAVWLKGEVAPVPFEISDATGLVQIDITPDVKNGWVWLDGEVTDDADNVVAAFEDGAEYYAGRDSEGRWSEGSRRIRIRADLPAGAYVLGLEVAENVGDKNWSGRPATTASVRIRQGVANVTWLVGAGLILLAGGGVFLAERSWHHQRRWAGSDWVDEDDD